MAQQQGSYNQFGQYGQVPGQPQQSFPRFDGNQGYRQQQYPQGTFQPPAMGTSSGTNTSDLSTKPPTGDPAPASAGGAAQGTSSTPAPHPVTSGAAGQQAPDTGTQQYPPGTFQQPAPSGGLGQASTGPVNMNLGAFGAPGAWDGGYNATFAQPAAQAAPPSSNPAAAAPPGAAPQSAAAPVAPSAPPPMPTGGAWGDAAHLDYFAKYGPGNSGLSQEQVNALIGKPNAAPNAATVAWNQGQQQFSGNNPGYATTGYLGNAAQVAAQRAGGAQANSIPLGVLGSDFYTGGAAYGGQQNAGNSLSGLNGTRNWNDPSVAGYGVYPPGTFQ